MSGMHSQKAREYVANELKKVIGSKIVGVQFIEAAGVFYPALLTDDRKLIIMQSDAEGNDGAWPTIELT